MANENRDNRLDQIKEGAGLETSRINQEFVDFIRKWSTPVLLIAALIALGYFLNNKRKEARASRVDAAFQEYNASTGSDSPSPDALTQIAEEYKGVAAVPVLALTAAADEYLRAVQRGVRPGAQIDPTTGELADRSELLTEEDRERLLSQAEDLYKQVFNATEKDPGLALHTLTALYGLAAVSESRGDDTAARNMLDRAKALAEAHGFFEQGKIADVRLAALPTLMGEKIDLPSKDELPEIPALKTDLPEPPAEDEGAVGPQLPEDDAAPGSEDEAEGPPAESDQGQTEGGADGAGTEGDAGDDGAGGGAGNGGTDDGGR